MWEYIKWGQAAEVTCLHAQQSSFAVASDMLQRIYGKKHLRRGYYIESGAVESANRYAVQDRLKKSGMMWSTKGANGIAKLKTTYLSGQWDTIWLAA